MEIRNEIKNNKTAAPIEHYSKIFETSDPEMLSARSGVPYDKSSQTFNLHLLGRAICVKWPSMQVVYADDSSIVRDGVRILMGRLVLEGKLAPSTGKMIPYTEVEWGQTYYKAFKGRCIDRLAWMFKTADDFAAAAQALGATPSTEGDASADFEFVDDVIVRLIVWERDDEFAPSAQILFSDNAPLAFTAEDLAQVGDVLLGELKRAKLNPQN